MRRLLVLSFLVTLPACQTSSEPVPAILESADPETLANLKSVIAAAMGKPRVEFGAGDLTQSSEIAVLPPRLGPHETRSPAVPTLFDLAMVAGDCVVIQRATGEITPAPNTPCKPHAD